MIDEKGIVGEIHKENVPEIYFRVFLDVEKVNGFEVVGGLDDDYSMVGGVVVGFYNDSRLVFVVIFHSLYFTLSSAGSQVFFIFFSGCNLGGHQKPHRGHGLQRAARMPRQPHAHLTGHFGTQFLPIL